MRARDRIGAALRHREPDRVPLDLGGMPVSSIAVRPYCQLEAHLGVQASCPRLYMPFNQAVEIPDPVLSLFGSDTRPLYLGPNTWRRERLPDCSDYEVPVRWVPQPEDGGCEVVVDDNGRPFARRPKGGDYFQRLGEPLKEATTIADLDAHSKDIERLHVPFYLDESLEAFGIRARRLRESSERFIIGNFHFSVLSAAQRLCGWEKFLMDLLLNQGFAEALLERIVEAHLSWFQRFMTVAQGCFDAIMISDDLGLQDGPIISPRLYRKMVKPFHRRLLAYIRSHSGAYLLLHCDGAIFELIPDLIEMGIDALNPIQDSARQMDLHLLKREYGGDITFWGAGCDTQSTLPFGTPDQVRDEVKQRIEQLAPGGGFVFAPVHSIPVGTPPENVVAMYEAIQEI